MMDIHNGEIALMHDGILPDTLVTLDHHLVLIIVNFVCFIVGLGIMFLTLF